MSTMSAEVFALILKLDRQSALAVHSDKPIAVAQRIGILAAKLEQPNLWKLLMARLSKKFQENLAELEALVHYGSSHVVWEIAYLSRKKAAGLLNEKQIAELDCLMLYHDCPKALRLTQLKVKELFGQLAETEARELRNLQRNIYGQNSVPTQLFDTLWPSTRGNTALDGSL